MKKDIVPKNSRYIPFTQQPSCCVPTCIQMVMYRHGIPLIPAEKIGYYLGLTVHPDRKSLFYNVRTSTERPPAGYGTRIYDPQYEPNTACKKLNIPLEFEIKLITKFDSVEKLSETLKEAETNNIDVLLCFHHGTLIDDPEKDYGHVCVFDRMIENKIRMIDPSPEHPKWRNVTVEKMYVAMKKHGEKRSAGLWFFTLIKSFRNKSLNNYL